MSSSKTPVRVQMREAGPYCLESDEDGHFYVIPVARMADWSEWLQSDDCDWGYET